MANVSVMGGVQNEFGITTAMKIHSKHVHETADAVLNIFGIGTRDGNPAHQDAPRPAYDPALNGFPKMLYKALPGEKGQHVVMHAAEFAEALKPHNSDCPPTCTSHGWREEPYPTVSVPVLDPQQEKKNLLDTNERLQSQLIQMQEQMDKMARLMQASGVMDGEPVKRGPGRPRVTE